VTFAVYFDLVFVKIFTILLNPAHSAGGLSVGFLCLQYKFESFCWKDIRIWFFGLVLKKVFGLLLRMLPQFEYMMSRPDDAIDESLSAMSYNRMLSY